MLLYSIVLLYDNVRQKHKAGKTAVDVISAVLRPFYSHNL